MQRAGIEQHGIARAQPIILVAVTIDDLSGKHINEFGAGVLKTGVRLRLLLDLDEIRFDDDIVALTRLDAIRVSPGVIATVRFSTGALG